MSEEIIETIIYKHWREFTDEFENFLNANKNSLFRGQSNYPTLSSKIVICDKEKWQPFSLQTTFQRYYSGPDDFNLHDTLDRFIEMKGKFKSLEKIQIDHPRNYLPLILYLRHAGVPMPVLDVTFNSLTALYFAVNDLATVYGVNAVIHANDSRYVSIYEFDCSILKKYFGAAELNEIRKYQTRISDNVFLITNTAALDYPNDNMKKQDGAFLYFNSNCSLVTHLRSINLEYWKKHQADLPKPIKHHKIYYGTIFDDFTKPQEENIFKFLTENGKSGFSLFSDEQALLFDFKNPRFLQHWK